MKDNFFKTIIQIIPSLIVLAFGNNSATLKLITALTVFIVMDIMSGFIKAIYAHNVQSKIWINGITKKVLIYLVIAVTYQIDKLQILGPLNLEDSTITFYLLGEILSIFENIKQIGLSIPANITDMTNKIIDLQKNIENDNQQGDK